jgi:hypothetical protein
MLVNGWQPAGRHRVQWNAEGLPAGIYLLQMTARGEMLTKKLVKI